MAVFDELYGIGFREYGRNPEKILAVTAEDVKRVAKKYINPEIFAAAVVKPEEANPYAEVLEANGR